MERINWLSKVKSVWCVFCCVREGLSGRVWELKKILDTEAVVVMLAFCLPASQRVPFIRTLPFKL